MTEFHLLDSIAIALTLAFTGGMVARLVGVPAIVGYLISGILLSPFTPGYDADVETLKELAEIGVIFLMFGVGLHFNIHDLLAVKNIAVPGAVVQIAATALITAVICKLFGLTFREGMVLGLAISVASTVVLIRALDDNGLLHSVHGRVAVGWLIVEDLATVIILVLLPVLEPNGETNFWREAGEAVGKAVVFMGLMFALGILAIPRLLRLVAMVGSRELFILSVVAMALGIATGAAVFGLSVALGAFVAGVVISETEVSHQAAADVLPLRDAFAVLFFVSVGMLMDPDVVVENLDLLVVVTAIVLFLKGVVALMVAALFPYPARTALTVAAGLAQVGEFSFIVADEALSNSLMDNGTYNVILAASVISIILNPVAFKLIPLGERILQGFGPLWRLLDHQGPPPEFEPGALREHVLIAGYGRVGELTGHALAQLNVPFAVVEANLELARRLGSASVPVIWGDAANAEVLEKAGIQHARLLVIAVPDESTMMLALANARHLRADVPVIVRARDARELSELRLHQMLEVVVPELEGGIEIMRQTLIALGFDPQEALHLGAAIRDIQYGPTPQAV